MSLTFLRASSTSVTDFWIVLHGQGEMDGWVGAGRLWEVVCTGPVAPRRETVEAGVRCTALPANCTATLRPCTHSSYSSMVSRITSDRLASRAGPPPPPPLPGSGGGPPPEPRCSCSCEIASTARLRPRRRRGGRAGVRKGAAACAPLLSARGSRQPRQAACRVVISSRVLARVRQGLVLGAATAARAAVPVCEAQRSNGTHMR